MTPGGVAPMAAVVAAMESCARDPVDGGNPPVPGATVGASSCWDEACVGTMVMKMPHWLQKRLASGFGVLHLRQIMRDQDSGQEGVLAVCATQAGA